MFQLLDTFNVKMNFYCFLEIFFFFIAVTSGNPSVKTSNGNLLGTQNSEAQVFFR